jgi:hypothetical protein
LALALALAPAVAAAAVEAEAEAAAVEAAVVAAEAAAVTTDTEALAVDPEESGPCETLAPAWTARQDYPNPSWRALVQAAEAEAAVEADPEALYS